MSCRYALGVTSVSSCRFSALGKKISSCSSSRRTLSGRGLRGGRFGASLKGLRRGTTSSGIGGGGGMSQNRRKSSTENATYALFIISIGFIVFITPYTLMAGTLHPPHLAIPPCVLHVYEYY